MKLGLHAGGLLVGGLVLAGCGGEESPEPTPEPPVVEPETCEAGTLAVEGGCLEPGVSACAEGFVLEDGGCSPVLPEAACPMGEMALPGETSCHPPSGCGAAPWGDVAIEAGAQFVDAGFGGASDGSQGAPWTTMQAGIDAAAAGAQVVVAAGAYVEDVVISGKAVRLLGRCSTMVSLSDASGPVTTLLVTTGASGSVVSGMSIAGSTRSLGVSGATDVELVGLRLHDTSNTALLVQDAFGPTSAVMRDSLIEQVGGAAALIEGAPLVMDRTVVRDTIPNGNGAGRGPNVQAGGELTVTSSVFARTHDVAIHLSGSTASLSGTAILDTVGRALNVQRSPDDQLPSSLAATTSVIVGTEGVSAFAAGSSLHLADCTVRDARPEPGGTDGWAVFGQDAGPEAPASVILERSLVDGYDAAGVNITGGTLTVAQSWVRGAATVSEVYGRGVNAQIDPTDGTPATAELRDSWIDDAIDAAVIFNGASGSILNVALNRTRPRLMDGAFGDGLVISGTSHGPTQVALAALAVRDNARAGLAVFAAEATLGTSRLSCNAIDINGESSELGDYAMEDLGDNVCGCADEEAEECKVLSSGLQPPSPLPAL